MSAPSTALPPPSFSGADPTAASPNRRQDQDARGRAWQREMEKAEAETWFRCTWQESGAAPAVVAGRVHGLAARAMPPPADLSVARPASADVSTTAGNADDSRAAGSSDPSASDMRSPRAAAPEAAAGSPRPTAGPGSARDRTLPGPELLVPAEDDAAIVGGISALRIGPGAALPTASVQGIAGSAESIALPTATATPSLGATAANAFASPAAPSTSTAPAIAAPALPPSSERLAAAVARAFEPAPPMRLHVEWNAGAATIWIGLDRGAPLELPQLVDRLARWMSRIGVRLRSVVCNGTVYFNARDGAVAPPDSTNVDIVVEKEN